MDFSNIKLIVSDMDGTLLNDRNEVSSRFFEQFKALKDRKIHFVAASGRQYQSILQKLDPIKDEISIIGENGGIMQHENSTQVLLKLSENDVLQCIDVLRRVDDCFIVLCGRKAAYVETKNTRFLSILKRYYAEIKPVEDLTKVTDDDFLKIAVYHFESSEEFVYPHIQKLKDDFQVIVSGQNWLDISHSLADKSYALKKLQQAMGLTEKDTLVFGDYNNDVGMLKLANMSFAMENAHPNVKQIARFQTKSNAEEGVEHIIDQLLRSRPLSY